MSRVSGELAQVIEGCSRAHLRLMSTVEALDDGAVRQPSRLPGWSVGHVLTHLARNADSHVRMLGAALRGASVEQYPGGLEQRSADIEAGATRPASQVREDVGASCRRLEEAWAETTPGAWEGHGLGLGTPWPCRELPFHRWREVELHHVDLGLGYGAGDWPEGYVGRELARALAALPDRLSPEDRKAVLAWLVGRAGRPENLALAGWQARREHYFVRR